MYESVKDLNLIENVIVIFLAVALISSCQGINNVNDKVRAELIIFKKKIKIRKISNANRSGGSQNYFNSRIVNRMREILVLDDWEILELFSLTSIVPGNFVNIES